MWFYATQSPSVLLSVGWAPGATGHAHFTILKHDAGHEKQITGGETTTFS